MYTIPYIDTSQKLKEDFRGISLSQCESFSPVLAQSHSGCAGEVTTRQPLPKRKWFSRTVAFPVSLLTDFPQKHARVGHFVGSDTGSVSTVIYIKKQVLVLLLG